MAKDDFNMDFDFEDEYGFDPDYFLGDEEEINVCCDSRVPYSNESKEKMCREKDLKEKTIEGVLKEKRKRGRPRKEKENEESND